MSVLRMTQKAIKVIRSCETPEQLKVAIRFRDLALAETKRIFDKHFKLGEDCIKLESFDHIQTTINEVLVDKSLKVFGIIEETPPTFIVANEELENE